MYSLLAHTVTQIWLLLAALTAVAWWLGVESVTAAGDPRWWAAGLMVLAFFKVRLVILYYHGNPNRTDPDPLGL